MDKTVKWFKNVLAWYVNIDERNKDGIGTYGCALPIPGELVNMKITTFGFKRGKREFSFIPFVLI